MTVRSVVPIVLAAALMAGVVFALPAPTAGFALTFGIGYLALVGRDVRRNLRQYWDRPSAAGAWRAAFPTADPDDVDRFLGLFVNAFAFADRRRSAFRPDDRAAAVYAALYPSQFMGDVMELERFADSVRDAYGLDLAAAWDDRLTLGDVYRMARAPRRPDAG